MKILQLYTDHICFCFMHVTSTPSNTGPSCQIGNAKMGKAMTTLWLRLTGRRYRIPKINLKNIANLAITQSNVTHWPRTAARNENLCVENVSSVTNLAKAHVVLAAVLGIKSAEISAINVSVTRGSKAYERVRVSGDGDEDGDEDGGGEW